MWAGILSALKAIGSAFAALFTYLAQGQLLDAGRAEAERDALERAAHDRKAADAIDHKPVPVLTDDILNRL